MRHAPREGLSRERIIAAALAIMDADGVDGLSMRRLGQALGVDPMAVYYHVPNKGALYDGIVEHLWGSVRLPAMRPGERWPDLLEQIFADFRARLLEHPLAVTLVGTRPAVSAAMLRLVDDSLGRLEAAGLSGWDAMELIDCLSGYVVGKVLAETASLRGADEVAASLSAVTAESHPSLAAVMVSGYGFSPDEEFVRGLQALIAGWR